MSAYHVIEWVAPWAAVALNLFWTILAFRKQRQLDKTDKEWNREIDSLKETGMLPEHKEGLNVWLMGQVGLNLVFLRRLASDLMFMQEQITNTLPQVQELIKRFENVKLETKGDSEIK